MPVLDKALRVRYGAGTYRLGDVKYGAPGGNPSGVPYVCSYEVADAMAAELGVSTEHAHRALAALGRVAQRLLLRGQPVGIPHLGTLHLVRRRQVIDTTHLAAYTERVHGVKAPTTGPMRVGFAYVKFRMPQGLRHLFVDNAIYTGTLAEHVKQQRERLKGRLRSRGGRSLVHRGARP